ncbi:MAG: TerC/Alx family metal homeostasis membrane protein [Planctomycetaceae bacterium]|nr:TerC/Alx family metal homeostasis membrane protein [Planctomycetaceae bacterium]
MLAYAVFSPLDYWPLLATFLGGVAALLALDLFVIERLAHGGATPAAQARRQMQVSVAWTAICVLTALGVAVAFRQFALAEITANPLLLEDTRYFKMEPAQAAGTLFLEFLTGYVVELSLSIDNLFVFLVIFRYFGLDHDKQHRVLLWGIVGALVFRAIFIGIGSLLVSYAWVLILMGVFLILTGVKLVVSEDKKLEPEKNPVIRMLSRVLPVAKQFDGTRFFTRIDGRLAATPLFVALIVVETTDIAFAVDSVPAVLAISQEPLVAFGSNICAILGLRAMFFVVAEAMQKFHLLKYGLGLVLVWVGLKMTVLPYFFKDELTNPQGHVPIPISLGMIVALIGGTMLLSLIIPPKQDSEIEPATDTDADTDTDGSAK